MSKKVLTSSENRILHSIPQFLHEILSAIVPLSIEQIFVTLSIIYFSYIQYAYR